MNNYFLNSVNRSVGDNMRFVRDYQANPDKYKVDPKPPETPPADPFQQMMMMMLFMMMMKMMESMGFKGGFPEFPGFPGFPPGGDFPWPPPGPGPGPGPGPSEPPINQNPAYNYLNDLLDGNEPGTGVPAVDFTSNDSILARIHQILGDNPDPASRELLQQLQGLDPASVDAETKLAELGDKLKAQGKSDAEIEELHLLIGGLTTNTLIATLEQIRTLLPDPELEARINELKGLRDGFAAQWRELHPPANNEPPADISEEVQKALAEGKFTEAELGQALKYMLDKAPREQMPAIRRLLTTLFDSGELSPVPFLQENYLEKLSDGRRNVLMRAIRNAGVRTEDGQANSKLLGFILQSLERGNNPEQQAFLKELLQQWQDRFSQRPDNAPGRQVFESLLQLANITVGEDGKLVFPNQPQPEPAADTAQTGTIGDYTDEADPVDTTQPEPPQEQTA